MHFGRHCSLTTCNLFEFMLTALTLLEYFMVIRILRSKVKNFINLLKILKQFYVLTTPSTCFTLIRLLELIKIPSRFCKILSMRGNTWWAMFSYCGSLSQKIYLPAHFLMFLNFYKFLLHNLDNLKRIILAFVRRFECLVCVYNACWFYMFGWMWSNFVTFFRVRLVFAWRFN